MIPSTWLPHHRETDDELVGYLAPARGSVSRKPEHGAEDEPEGTAVDATNHGVDAISHGDAATSHGANATSHAAGAGAAAEVSDAAVFIPMTLFGYGLSAGTSEDDARNLLDAVGLSNLAEPWILHRRDLDPLRVRIAEVTPDHVVVGIDDYNVGIRAADRIVVPVPTLDSLTPARPSRG